MSTHLARNQDVKIKINQCTKGLKKKKFLNCVDFNTANVSNKQEVKELISYTNYSWPVWLNLVETFIWLEGYNNFAYQWLEKNNTESWSLSVTNDYRHSK